MLLRFSVENHRSIGEQQELVLAASTLKDRSDGLIPCYAAVSGTVVPAAVIYGANASGKTSVIDALYTMRKWVLRSQDRVEPKGGIPRNAYRLDPAFSDKPSRFGVDFLLDGVRYVYGFEATDDAFTSEWLYEVPRSHGRRLFEREGQRFHFGRQLRGPNKSVAVRTGSNSLFLWAAAQRGHPRLSPIHAYFREMTFPVSSSARPLEMSSRVLRDPPDHRVLAFLKSIGTGIVGYRRRRSATPEKRGLRPEVPAALDRAAGVALSMPQDREDTRLGVELARRARSGAQVRLDTESESSGTLRLLVLLDQAFRALDSGRPMIVDDLDTHLHTYVVETVLGLFCSLDRNPNGAQLIATTHDTNLMNSALLRRDQIWFTERTSDGATVLFPLTDFRTRKGDNVEYGYLQGRFGAVPGNGNLSTLRDSI